MGDFDRILARALQPLTLEERQQLGDFVGAHGAERAAAQFRLSTTAITRGLAGLRLQPGSRELIRQGLARVASPPPSAHPPASSHAA